MGWKYLKKNPSREDTYLTVSVEACASEGVSSVQGTRFLGMAYQEQLGIRSSCTYRRKSRSVSVQLASGGKTCLNALEIRPKIRDSLKYLQSESASVQIMEAKQVETCFFIEIRELRTTNQVKIHLRLATVRLHNIDGNISRQDERRLEDKCYRSENKFKGRLI